LKIRSTSLWMAIYALQECIPPTLPLLIQKFVLNFAKSSAVHPSHKM